LSAATFVRLPARCCNGLGLKPIDVTRERARDDEILKRSMSLNKVDESLKSWELKAPGFPIRDVPPLKWKRKLAHDPSGRLEAIVHLFDDLAKQHETDGLLFLVLGQLDTDARVGRFGNISRVLLEYNPIPPRLKAFGAESMRGTREEKHLE